jgi:hypothetical protein
MQTCVFLRLNEGRGVSNPVVFASQIFPYLEHLLMVESQPIEETCGGKDAETGLVLIDP